MKYLCIASKAHHSKTAWGNAPGSLKRQALALKARFIAGQARHLRESRFQRLPLGQSNSGAMAPAERDVAPLALHQT
jgi:hypothetical protein